MYTINADGVKTEECWYKAPFCGIIHDCGISDNWVVLPMTPLKCDPERLKKGENHWAWDPDEDQWYGLVPRRGGKPEDIRWFRSKNGERTQHHARREKINTISDAPSSLSGPYN